MAAYFFDSSALVKRYLREMGTTWVQSCTDPANGHRVTVIRITAVEVTSAVARRRRGGLISVAQAAVVLVRFGYHLRSEYRVLELTPTLLSRAVQFADRFALRAYDAVQLASAAAVHAHRGRLGLSPVTFVSADRELNTAAGALGIPVDDPNTHP